MCCTAISSGFASVANGLSGAFKSATDTISNSYRSFSTRLDGVLDTYLHEKIAYVAKKAIHSLPITLGMLYLPMSVTIPCLAIYAICRIVHPKPFTNDVVGDVNTGIGHGFVVGALRETVKIFQKTQTNVLPLIIDLLCAAFFHNRAHKAYNNTAKLELGEAGNSKKPSTDPQGAAATGGASSAERADTRGGESLTASEETRKE